MAQLYRSRVPVQANLHIVPLPIAQTMQDNGEIAAIEHALNHKLIAVRLECIKGAKGHNDWAAYTAGVFKLPHSGNELTR